LARSEPAEKLAFRILIVFETYPESEPPYFYVRLIFGNEYFYWSGESVMPFEEQNTVCVY